MTSSLPTTAVRLEAAAQLPKSTNHRCHIYAYANATNSSSGSGSDSDRDKKPYLSVSVSKPSWIVRTESNVRKEETKKPEPPCVVCQGSGRVNCHDCAGQGRTNCVHLSMLPKGEWPKWCKTCGGSGLSYCSRCLGTGEYRYIMGFHFMNSPPPPPPPPPQ